MSTNIILVTGATGFIGLHLTKYLIERNYEVRVLVRETSPRIITLKELDVEIFYGDICKPSTLSLAFKDVEKVFHCAAYVSDWGPLDSYHKINTEGTQNILEACVKAQVKKFIGLSTNDVFGMIEGKIINENFPLKKWNEPYPDSKIEAEKLIWHYHKKFNLPVTLSYPCWVYGEEDTTFLPLLIEALEDGSFLYWRNDSHFYPTYIYNLLDQLHLISINDKAIGNGYLIHDGNYITLKEFCDKLSSNLKIKKVKLKLPYKLIYGFAKSMEAIWKLLKIKNRPLLTTYVVKNFGGKFEYSIEKSKTELGWTPPYTFQEGFTRTINWIKKTKAPKS